MQILPEESLETVKATVQGATESAKEMMSEGIQSESLESAKVAVMDGAVRAQQMVTEGVQHFDATSSLESAKATVQGATGVSKVHNVHQMLPEESLETVKATVQGATESAKEMRDSEGNDERGNPK
eukprot:TRINITY_DN557_c0_g1_i11.p2 TRINITY_DN557_c0_g1~~TRINITY_DN557_c0_g1_i11.p2  ORF type:complete len:126 (+),score=40.18 TRINITY_DN557_c0_g1_i11:59-436(+)